MVKRMIVLCSATVLYSWVLLSQPVMAATTWQQSGGPEGAIIYALAVDPTNSQTVYVGTETGGVFKTSNGGASWSPASSGLPYASIYFLAIDPANQQTIYAATGDEEYENYNIYKSINGGNNWQLVSSKLSIAVYSLAIDPADPQTIYAGTWGGGVMKSSDGGDSWNPINVGLGSDAKGFVYVVIDPARTQTIYVLTDGGVYKSTNGGGFWHAVNNGLSGNSSNVYDLAVNPTNPDTLYIGTDDGVYKSTNGGISWSECDSNLTNLTAYGLVIDPSSPQTIYAVINGNVYQSRNGVYKSTDGGDSWHTANSGLPGDGSCFLLTMAPNAPQTLYAEYDGYDGYDGYGGVFKSINSGDTWNAVNSGLSNRNVSSLAYEPGNSQAVYAGSDGVVYKSTNGGSSWSAVITGLDVTSLAIDPITPQNIYAGTSDSGVVNSKDGGVSWISAKTWPDSGAKYNHCLAVDSSNPQIVYTGTYSGVFKSMDGGNSWYSTNSGLSSLYAYALAIDPITPQTIYAGTQDGVFKSINGGASWSLSNDGAIGKCTGVTAVAISPTNPQTIYAAATEGVFKSTDGGESWTGIGKQLAGKDGWSLLAVDPLNPLVVYVHTWKGMFKTTNGGVSWSVAESGLNGFWVMSMVIDPSNSQKLYAGTYGGGVYKGLSIPDLPTITTGAPLPSGTYGVSYSKTLAATGATKPYTWSIIAGELPEGITLNAANGALKGKPTGWGDFTFTVQVADKYGYATTKDIALTILVPQLTITTAFALPNGKVGASYKKALAAKGGVKPYAWSVSSGALPGGLTLDVATGIISGKPVSAGSYSFTIQLADGRPEVVTKDVTLVVK